jgi:hypothetical protein
MRALRLLRACGTAVVEGAVMLTTVVVLDLSRNRQRG